MTTWHDARYVYRAQFHRTPGTYRLTVREQQIFDLAHLTGTQIALRLQIGIATVHNHLTKIYMKTGTRNRAELLALRDRPERLAA